MEKDGKRKKKQAEQDDEKVFSFILRMSSVMAGCHHPQTILKHIFLPRVGVQIDFLSLSHNYDSFFKAMYTIQSQ